MFENSPALELTVGRSTVRQNILVLLMAGPGSRLHLREIQRRAGTSPGTASRELAKLVAAGLVEREAEGNQVYFRASASPFATMLRSILVAMPGPDAVARPPRVARARGGRQADSPAVTAPASRMAVQATIEPAGDAGVAVPPPVVPGATASPTVPVATAAPAITHLGVAVAPDALGLMVASRLAASIRSIYGESLRGVYLYGARAAGAAPADADVETVIVLDRVDHYGAELEKTSHVCASLSRECGVVVSRIFVADSVWESGAGGTLASIRAEAMAL
jgi:DNA-binding transcriptional ArsR family regulator